MILLHGDVVRLCIRAANLVLSSGCVTKNVANVVVTKHKRSTVVAARRVIPEDIHHIPAHLALTRQRRDTDR